MTLTHLYLIRHGETTWNAESRWQGQLDAPLNERGIQQARLLSTHLQDCPLIAFYSSDLSRARVTADILAEAHGLRALPDVRWREMHMGILQGRTRTEIESGFRNELDGLRDNWWDHRVQGGETRRAMLNRLQGALDAILADSPAGDVAVVTHGGCVRVLVHHLFPIHSGGLKTPIENTSLTTLKRVDGGWQLVGLAETPHLTLHEPQKPGEGQ
jgi:broad specificity phosphatase PhoE